MRRTGYDSPRWRLVVQFRSSDAVYVCPRDRAQHLGLLGQARRVEVTQQDAHRHLGHAALDAVRVQEAVALVRGFRRQALARQAVQE